MTTNNKKALTFEEAVRSGKNFRRTRDGLVFVNNDSDVLLTEDLQSRVVFKKHFFDDRFEIIEPEITITESKFEEGIGRAGEIVGYYLSDRLLELIKKELGF